MKKELQIYSELNDIITSLTGAIAINSISEVDGVSTINTDSVVIFDNLSDIIVLTSGMIVTLDNINYSVSNVVNNPVQKSFDITATDLTATEWNVAANFQTGSRKEINQILQQDAVNLDRFPLIWLLPPSNLDFDHNLLDFTADITLVFAHKANATDRTVKRLTNTFDPVIQPLLKVFNKWLTSSDFNYMLEFFGKDKPIDYEQTNFAFYGADGKGVFTSVSTDAIEVSMTLSFKRQYIDPSAGTSQFKLLTGGCLLLLN